MKKIDYKYDEDKALLELNSYIEILIVNTTVRISFRQLNLLLMVVMVRVSVSVTYSSMHKDTEKRMARIEKTC